MALGLKQAGLKPKWSVDADRDACATYAANIGAHAICSRVERVDFSELGAVSGLAFGFPCNDFSLVGERKGSTGYFGGLFREAVRALDEVRPKWFVAENVPGLMASEGQGILQAFADAGPGYKVAVHLFRFEDYGVPQRRHRIIAVGLRSDNPLEFRPPEITHPQAVSARQALDAIPEWAAHQEMPRHSDKVRQMLESIPPGANAWHPDVPEELRLNVAATKLSLIYRRLHPDEPAYTLVASGGGGTHSYHFEEPRALTNRERARLQTFPDDFVFTGSKESIRKQIGMAVPPRGAEVIGKGLIAALQGRTRGLAPSHGYLYARAA